MQVWSVCARRGVGFILCGTAVFGNAQTTVNNTVYNTNIIIQNQRTVWANNPVPVIRNLPRPPAPVFQYQPRELLPYMSPRCAQLYEAELGGFTRRTSGSVGAGVHNEFLSSCPDAMSEARQSLNRDKLEKYNATQDQKSAARSSAQRDKITREQCDELLRILAGQRKRIDSMSDGEKADHAHSEQNYAARCKAAA